MKPPRIFFQVPLARPYWQRSTYRSIIDALGAGSIVAGAESDKLRLLILREMQVDQAFLCSSGSLALELALRGCKVVPGDEVVLPTFCCAAVVLPVLAVGATVVLADIGPELNLTVDTVGRVLTQKTKAIIVPHLFGNPAEIVAIIELARARGISVIDDAAQALGATIDGRPVGSFGDAGVVSFGAEKVCSGLGGGALLAPNGNLPAAELASPLQRPTTLPTIENLFSVLVRRRWHRWTLPFVAGLQSKNRLVPDTPLRLYRKEGISNLNAAVALTLMHSLTDNIAARRIRVRRYTELLHGIDGLELIAHRSGSACLTQVIRVRAKREDRTVAVIHALRRAGYEVQGSYVPIHRLSNYSMCVWDNVSYAERIWSDLVELPCEPDVKIEHLERIADVVKAVLRE